MGGRSRKSKNVKRLKALQAEKGEEQEIVRAPHSFIIQRGKVGKQVRELIRNMRRVMSPFTAENLKERNKNMLKDFIAMAGPLSVTHMMLFSKTDKSVNLRICRLPRGPTLTFQVKSYSTIRDLSQIVRKHDDNPSYFLHHALLVMNNFKSDCNHLKLTSSMFQNMFPSININTVKLKEIKRVALMNYDSETDTVEFRHYYLRVVPVGMSKPVSKLLSNKVPTLAKYEDISQFLLDPGALSESEAELDGEPSQVELPQPMSGRGNMKNAQSAIRLREIGPRMTLTLVKIADGVCDGDVLYHKFIKKTEQEIKQQQLYREKKQKIKMQRRKEQEKRVKQKQAEKENLRKKCASGQKANERKVDDTSDNGDDKDDAEYFEEEVGHKPPSELFPKNAVRKAKVFKRKSTDAGKSNRIPTKTPRLSNGKKSDSTGKKFTGGVRNNDRPTKQNKKPTTQYKKPTTQNKKSASTKPGQKKSTKTFKRQSKPTGKRNSKR